MQQQVAQPAQAIIAPEPGRKITRNFFLFLSIIAITIALLFIGTLFLPEPLRDEISWNQFSPATLLPPQVRPFSGLITGIVIGLIAIYPFINISIMKFPSEQRWRIIEKQRQAAIEDHLAARPVTTLPLPKVHTSAPETMSIQLRRNWRATWVALAVITPLFGLFLLIYILDCQSNLNYLAQQGEISGWTAVGALYRLLLYYLPFLPAQLGLLLAPRQLLLASEEGLTCYRGLHRSSIPWREARLFAVIDERKDTLVYELSSSTELIRWSSKPAWSYADSFPAATIGVAPFGLVKAQGSTAEYQEQVRQLTALVAKRTGLPLYDLRTQMVYLNQYIPGKSRRVKQTPGQATKRKKSR